MMQAVLKHNEWDLLAMPALMIALDEVYRGRTSPDLRLGRCLEGGSRAGLGYAQQN